MPGLAPYSPAKNLIFRPLFCFAIPFSFFYPCTNLGVLGFFPRKRTKPAISLTQYRFLEGVTFS